MTTSSTSAKSKSFSSPSKLRDSLDRDGFVVIPSFYSPAEIDRLRSAASTAIDLARKEKWPFIRTLPKQFPPWTSSISSGIWGVQHLLHPSMPPPTRSIFIESYFNPRMIDVIKEILSDSSTEIQDKDLVMELYNLLIRPDRNFELRWHRDGIPRDARPEEEVQILQKRIWHTQWNAALFDDNSLIVIPGSHRRSRTEEERNADEYSGDLEGIKIVEMRAGDVVFYNNNILHRGAYDSGKERMTLHGSIGCVQGGNERATNVLQHGVGEWVGGMSLDCLKGKERERAEGMRKRLVDMGSAVKEVGHIHDG